MIGFFDLEFNPKNELLVIGILFKKRYYYFTNILDFINFLKNSKIKILYGYNIEYDIGIIIRKINLEKYKIKLKCIYNMCGMVSSELDIDDKKIKVKDLSRHVPIGLGKIGEMIGMKKMEIDYNFNKIDKKLIEYNKNDLKITYMLYNRLNKCYKKLHTGIKNTIASTSFAIYKKMIHIPTVDENIKEVFIKAYKGGLVNVYKTGTYEGNFFKLDVNSLYPFVMLSQFTNPTTYYISNKPSGKMYLIIYDDGDVFTNYDTKTFNINKKIKCYICFKQYIYPFKLYIEKINKYKENAKNDLERTIF
ncbi:MAG: DNA polymerase, partial [Candidatus Goldbacteria bacterium]|nr:DNA polymerase [Candidatus Goldiibacteriota bacterium]